jgi:hypothetical protein
MAEMSFAEHNNMVKTIPSDRTDEPLRISILPWLGHAALHQTAEMAGGTPALASRRVTPSYTFLQQIVAVIGYCPQGCGSLLHPELNQLDAGAPRVGDVGDGCAGPQDPTVRLIKLDAFCLDLLHEGRKVLHV